MYFVPHDEAVGLMRPIGRGMPCGGRPRNDRDNGLAGALTGTGL